MLRLYSTAAGLVFESKGKFFRDAWGLTLDIIFSASDPQLVVSSALAKAAALPGPLTGALRAPLQSQEVWAAGVTYLRSKSARMEEAKSAGGGDFYDRVYAADRPELFFKATPHRVAGPGDAVRIRRDSTWNVPEPELALAISAHGRIFGYTAGNDMSSRDIEGENPLYLPQAKVYDGCAALGPCLVVTPDLPAPGTAIRMRINRAGAPAFAGETAIDRIQRPLPSLADWLFREQTFPHGCYLMTGTGIVPPDSFTLQRGDEIHITIDPVGTLVNTVA